MKRLAIFKTGTHTATNGSALIASAEMLKNVAANYAPATHEAPAVIGHPKDNHPAYAWVESLSFDDSDGVLYANFSDVEPQFAQLIKDGRFKKRSASFYPPNHPSNPTAGKPYLRHVGFLGAQPPAVKGLKDFTDFGDVADLPTYEFAEFTTDANAHSINQNQDDKDNSMTDKANPDTTANSTDKTTDDARLTEQQAALDAKEKALAAKEAAIEAREAAFAKQEQDIKENDFSEFADGLIKKGQLVPAEKNAVISVMMDLDGADKTFDFAENGAVHKKSSVDVLKGVLGRLSATVDFSEHSSDDPNHVTKPQHGFDTKVTDDELDKKITDFAEAKGISYAEAAVSFSE